MSRAEPFVGPAGQRIDAHPEFPLSLGAIVLGRGRCRFCVWAPNAHQVEVHLYSPEDRLLPMHRDQRGYFHLFADNVRPGALYKYRLDGRHEFPDPASRFQPRGVHQPSQVVDPHFDWTDSHWHGIPLEDHIFYELHVGTFTPEGTFEAIIDRLDMFKDLGVTAIELMPVAQFPGARNWGYDGVYPFAVQNTYGGPVGLKRLVNACHMTNLAVILDVVYNHIGPEGNYLGKFGNYFSEMHHTLWGPSLNFDGSQCDEVRRLFIENALYWVNEFHFDGFRLDATDAIFDQSARPFLGQLADAIREYGNCLNRRVHTFAETSTNDSRFIRSREVGGYGLDAQWNDEFHHGLHTELTGEKEGYYLDFHGLPDLMKSWREGYVYTGQYSVYRRRRVGNSARDLPASRFVVCAQNHDQVGNRRIGDRLTHLCDFEQLKLAAANVLLSPALPLLFMGEEHAETAPFEYFIHHSDPALIEAVRQGRKHEFASFHWEKEPPDPQAEITFQRSKINHDLKRGGKGQVLYEFYKRLIHLRKHLPSLGLPSRDHLFVEPFRDGRGLVVERWTDIDRILALFHFGDQPVNVGCGAPPGYWRKRLDSAEPRWQGPGSTTPDEFDSAGRAEFSLAPRSVVLYSQWISPIESLSRDIGPETGADM